MLSPLIITPSLAKEIQIIIEKHQNMIFLPANAILEASKLGHFFAFSHSLHPLIFYGIREHGEYAEFASVYAPGLGSIIIKDFEKKRKEKNIPYAMAVSSLEKVITSITKNITPIEFDFPHVISEERRYTHEGIRKHCVIWK